MLKEGMILAERYEIISKIGTGGMADVYKARDHKLNRLVAVKVLKAEFRDDKSFIAKFQKEAQAAAGLAHPNIVNIYDVGEDEGVNFIVMELVEGITLKDYITKKGKLSVKEATSIAIQVSLGLEAAHNSNIVHRDVKPQNIIISTDGKVKLSDFGIARVVTSNTITSNVMVSVHYSSPEQVRGGYSDKKSDIYSLGITMYEMVTGRVPFDGDTSVAIAIKHLQEEMVPPSRYTPDLPFSLEQIILKCTQKSVDRRYNNLSEVIEDLKRSLVDPQGDFVSLAPLSDHAQTVRMSEEEMNAIKESRPSQEGQTAVSQPEQQVLYDDDMEDDEEYDEDEDDEDGISSKLEKAMTIGGFIIGAIIICILVYFIGTAAGVFRFGSNSDGKDQQVEEQEPTDEAEDTTAEDMVTVPDLRGMTVEEAEDKLQDTGLGLVKGGEEASSDYPAGQIMAQNYDPGSQVEKHTTIEYTLSTGTATLTVPNVVNQPQADAEATLQDMGLQTSIQNDYSADVAVGNVISVSPEVGTEVNAGDTVTLVVSLGVSDAEVTVPSVRGISEADARSTLENMGLVVTVETGSSNSVAEGEVYDQSIDSGTTVNAGTSITIYVNNPGSTSDETARLDPDGTENGSYSGSWVCTDALGQPSNYAGGPVQLVLEQDGQSSVTIVDGQQITFPYTLNVAGADGLTDGTVVLYEMVGGDYVERATYPVTFSQAQ
ncbi:MAG: Stk1 family PASTA domain-containing Ser/Thr kinase [Ruminococcus sp.]|jgi:serine/threonine protein kinase/beta-lactam-binding protein with PASTA domain